MPNCCQGKRYRRSRKEWCGGHDLLWEQWPFSQRFGRIRRRLATDFLSQKTDSNPAMLSPQSTEVSSHWRSADSAVDCSSQRHLGGGGMTRACGQGLASLCLFRDGCSKDSDSLLSFPLRSTSQIALSLRFCYLKKVTAGFSFHITCLFNLSAWSPFLDIVFRCFQAVVLVTCFDCQLRMRSREPLLVSSLRSFHPGRDFLLNVLFSSASSRIQIHGRPLSSR